jgi:peptidoglycan/LPS O-acetylase OafA/YrhL
MPEIDGLRFLAIFSVVFIMHISHYLDEKFYGNSIASTHSYWADFIYEGGYGVPLFFIISGFILSLPFARWRLRNEKKVSLKRYFIRRVFRLEPPYLIALVILFVAHVWILHNYSFQKLFPHLLASAVYMHGAIYHSFSPVLPVAWSLEVEVQFYVLAPLLCSIFLLRNRNIRWAIMMVIIISSALFWYGVWGVPHVLKYLHYFFIGILLSDWFVTGKRLFKNETAGITAAIIALLIYFFLPSINNLWAYMIKILSMWILVHVVLTNASIKKLFSKPVLVWIGGMCYSIYLLHFAIVSAAGQILLRWNVSAYPALLIPLSLLFAALVLMISSVFYLLVERPFMRPVGLPVSTIESSSDESSAS